MDLFNIITYLIVLSSLFGYMNVRFLKLPAAIGLMAMAIIFSVVMILLNYFDPDIFHYAESVVQRINFSDVVLNGCSASCCLPVLYIQTLYYCKKKAGVFYFFQYWAF